MKSRLTFVLGLCAMFAASALVAQDPGPAAVPTRSAEQLDELLGPIALYPDALVALILPAATVSSDVVLAQRYLVAGGDVALIDDQAWDDSVKSLAHYPDVIRWMDENLEWTQQVGEAFVIQPADVMKSIQRLRARARAVGTLTDTPQQLVMLDDDAIRIVPAQPDVIYVPYYDPEIVYVERRTYYPDPFLTFGFGCSVGWWLSYDCDWHHRSIWVSHRRHDWFDHHDWRHPVFPGHPGYVSRPDRHPWTPSFNARHPDHRGGFHPRGDIVRPTPHHDPRGGGWDGRRDGHDGPRSGSSFADRSRDSSNDRGPGANSNRSLFPNPPRENWRASGNHGTRSSPGAESSRGTAPTVITTTTSPAIDISPPQPSSPNRGGNWRDHDHDGDGDRNSRDRGNRGRDNNRNNPSSTVTPPAVVTAPPQQPATPGANTNATGATSPNRFNNGGRDHDGRSDRFANDHGSSRDRWDHRRGSGGDSTATSASSPVTGAANPAPSPTRVPPVTVSRNRGDSGRDHSSTARRSFNPGGSVPAATVAPTPRANVQPTFVPRSNSNSGTYRTAPGRQPVYVPPQSSTAPASSQNVRRASPQSGASASPQPQSSGRHRGGNDGGGRGSGGRQRGGH